MRPASTIQLSIRIVPETINFFVSEVRMLNLPKRKFGVTWRSGDSFTAFCNDTILRVLENLIINKVLVCHTEIKQVPFLYFFRRTEINDYFILSTSLPTQVGLLEDQIFKIATGASLVSAERIIGYLISYTLGSNGKLTNPWREIIKKVIEANRLIAWAFTYNKTLFGKKIEVTIKPAVAQAFSQALNAVEEQCANERNNNTEFAELSYRLMEIIHRDIKEHQDEPDGGG
jgi:hypothetical protein